MIGVGARRGVSIAMRMGQATLSRRAMTYHKRAAAVSVCLSHKMSLSTLSGSSIAMALDSG